MTNLIIETPLPEQRQTTRSETDLILLKPQRQQVWTGHAAVNFAFGGAGAALWLLAWYIASLTGTNFPVERMRLLGSGLVAFGLLAVALEAGRPQRARYLIGNLRRSWMARETLAALILLAMTVISVFVRHPAVMAVSCAAAAAFIVAQGMVLFDGRAVAAWNSRWIPAVFISSSFTAAGGVVLLVIAFGRFDYEPAVVAVGIVSSLADIILWATYITSTSRGAGRIATAALRTRPAIWWIIGAGRVFPVLILLPAARYHLPWPLVAGAGLALFLASWAQKHFIICRCGFLNSVTIKFKPVTFGSLGQRKVD